MFQFTNLDQLHVDMAQKEIYRTTFPFQFKGNGLSCIFITNTIPYRLYITTLGNAPFSILLMIDDEYRTSEYLGDNYSKLLRYLGIKYTEDATKRFRPSALLQHLDNNIPSICNNQPRYNDILAITSLQHDIEEADKRYFCGWHTNPPNKNVRANNLIKTRLAFGDEYAEMSMKHNISSRWTYEQCDEDLTKLNHNLR